MTTSERGPTGHDVTIERYFAAMRSGAAAESDVLALFTDDATYVEPFSGSDLPAEGKAAVCERLRSGWETPLPAMELDVLVVEIVGDVATARWECRSTALPAPVRGTDRYEFAGGLIRRLEVTIDET